MVSKTSFLLYAHSGSHNHGCEALLRTVTDQLSQNFASQKITVCSFRPEEDKKAGVPNINAFINHNNKVKQFSPSWLIQGIHRKMIKNPGMHYRITQKHVIDAAQKSDICISIGGDVYCYNRPYIYYTINNAIKRSGEKLVLWGCSIDKEHIDDEMMQDLAQFDLIMPRESITMETLCNMLPNNNIVRVNDPAFAMPSEFLPNPEGWQEGNMIGLNVSPLCAAYEENKGITLKSFHNLIGHILNTTNCSIALIPHVVRDPFSDMLYLTKLYGEFKSTGRVVLLSEEYNAPQLKGFISKCSLFIGARTHATIAGYSTGVPTLTLGYSVKARGIARDIFGDETGLVLPVQKLNNADILVHAFEELKERKAELKSVLQTKMPDYIADANNAVTHVKKLKKQW